MLDADSSVDRLWMMRPTHILAALVVVLVAGWGVSAADVVLFEQDFKGELTDSGSGLWHVTDANGVLGVELVGANDHAAYFGMQDASAPNYDQDGLAYGELLLTPQPIDISGCAAFRISFDYWREVERFAGGPFDEARMEIRLDRDKWRTLWERSSMTDSRATWTTELGSEAILTDDADTLEIRVVFDSVDGRFNRHIGWLIDNVVVRAAPEDDGVELSEAWSGDVPGAKIPEAEDVSIRINDVQLKDSTHATEFACDDEGIEWTVVMVCNLSGKCFWTRAEGSSVLVPHQSDDEYRMLPGPHLFRAILRRQGEWIRTGMGSFFTH